MFKAPLSGRKNLYTTPSGEIWGHSGPAASLFTIQAFPLERPPPDPPHPPGTSGHGLFSTILGVWGGSGGGPPAGSTGEYPGGVPVPLGPLRPGFFPGGPPPW